RHGALGGCDDLPAGASPRSGVLRCLLQTRRLPANPRRAHGAMAWGRRLPDLKKLGKRIGCRTLSRFLPTPKLSCIVTDVPFGRSIRTGGISPSARGGATKAA